MSRYTQYFGKNNVKSELAVGISSIATTIQVNENQGNLRGTDFPVLGTLEHYDSNGKISKREIVKVLSRSGDTFTVERKFAPCPPSDDSTTQSQVSNSFDPDDSFSIYIPYEVLNAVSEAINDLYNNGNDRLFLKKTTGLGFEITPGNARFETGEAYFPGGTGTVVDNSMNYVMIDSSFNIIVNQEELFDVQNISIAEVKAVNGEITEIVSRKIDGIAGRMGGGGDSTYGDGSDGELVISENTILNAGQTYQFTNLTICSGAVLSFSGTGCESGPIIKVSNQFINNGCIDMSNFDIVCACSYQDSSSFCSLSNVVRNMTIDRGKGGNYGVGGCYAPQTGCCVRYSGCGGRSYETGTACVGAGGNGSANTSTSASNGQPGCGGCGGGGGGAVGGNAGCPGDGCNGGNGGNTTKCNEQYIFAPGGGGGGGGYGGNGGSGGNGGGGANQMSSECGCYNPKVGGDGGNSGMFGRGGDGGDVVYSRNGIAGNGGDGYCGGNGGCGDQYGVNRGSGTFVPGRRGSGGNGGNGYYGGNGGAGSCYAMYSNSRRVCCLCCGGDGGNGGNGAIPGRGGKGGEAPMNGNTMRGAGGKGGNGGNGRNGLYSLLLKAKCFCNTGYIMSVGAPGGRGGDGGPLYGLSSQSTKYCGKGGNGGNGGTGSAGGYIVIITSCNQSNGTVSVAGGVGGNGGCGATGACCGNGANGTKGANGASGCLQKFILKG